MSHTKHLCSLLSILALLILPTTAAGQDAPWQLRIAGIWVDPDVDFTDLDSDGDRIEAGADADFGFSLALERRVSSRLGVEIGALFSKPDLTLDADLGEGLRFQASEGVSFTAVTAGLNIHLTPDNVVDLYVGPLLAYVLFGDIGLRAQTAGVILAQDFSSNDDLALGAQIGADISFGESSWSLSLGAKYLDTSLEITNQAGEVTDLGFEPIILNAGFGYRF